MLHTYTPAQFTPRSPITLWSAMERCHREEEIILCKMLAAICTINHVGHAQIKEAKIGSLLPVSVHVNIRYIK